MINNIYKALMQFEQVEAIALGGSRARHCNDERSDYDVYVYLNSELSNEKRKKALEPFCSYLEVGNTFFELGDEGILLDGLGIDIMYRDLDSFTKDIASVVEQYNAHLGYTTCMWNNLMECEIIYDPDHKLETLKERFNVSYPKQLKENIIYKNKTMLNITVSSYKTQILKAVERKDLNSINHRTAAFLESYFDIIFALNELTHPGEKRLIPLCLKNCKVLPKNFEDNLNRLYKDMFSHTEYIESDLDSILNELEKVI